MKLLIDKIMANTLTTKKNIRVTARRTAINRSRKSRIRTFLRKVEEAISQNDKEQAKKMFVEYESELAKSINKGIYKRNTVARKLKSLYKKVRSLE